MALPSRVGQPWRRYAGAEQVSDDSGEGSPPGANFRQCALGRIREPSARHREMGDRIKLERGEMADALDHPRSSNKGWEIGAQAWIVAEDRGHGDTGSSR